LAYGGLKERTGKGKRETEGERERERELEWRKTSDKKCEMKHGFEREKNGDTKIENIYRAWRTERFYDEKEWESCKYKKGQKIKE